LKTIKEIIQLSTEYLEKAKLESPRVDAEWLISDALKMPRMQLYLQFDRPLDEDSLSEIRTRIARRAKHEPVQYITGSTEFYAYEFKVGPGVLIPRPETELLVDLCLKSLQDGMSVLDLCTGSGCIAISLKKSKKNLIVTATDICSEALKYAKENIALNEVEIELSQGNLFSGLTGRKFNVICSNPPYVGELEKSMMGRDVLLHEPEKALFAGLKGFDIFHKIAIEAKNYLYSGGFIFLEMGAEQGLELTSIFEQNGWSDVSVHKDYTGRERFLKALYIS
jgi:release factor glutamine methyltransferase